ncbi:N-acetylmuramoyl-L-alanine amidase family protein [Lachnoanaerobaculum orale]|uniref:N-acetylmuramoyl-L-alanine amidase family protein n=1 Tax=Lachnoanaerobaculum orale TaxID=979627 RepID=UPI0023A7AF92|nr:hypothetical protein [Lachnoanaerobaculum orale]
MKKIKRKIASLLVGTMVLTQPATLSAWGNPVTQPPAPTGSGFQFNFTELNPSLKKIVKNVNIPGGTPNALIDSGSDFYGMDVNHANHYVYLPFVKPDTSNPDNGTFDNTKSLNGKNWDNIGLEGYAIEHWMNDKENGFGLWRMDGLTYPSTGKTYYAKLKADTSKNYNLKVQYTADNGVYVPGLPADSTTTKNVLEAIPQSPLVPDGFMITNTDADDTVKFYDHSTATPFTTEFTGFTAGDAGFTMDINKNLSGTMVNKDTEITFNYNVNQDVKKALQVVDEIYQDAALSTLSKSTPRVGGLYYEAALTDIGAKNIMPDASNGTKDAAHATSADRYIYDGAVINYITSEKNIKDGIPAANATLLSGDAGSGAHAYDGLKVNTVYSSTDFGKITGQMPNQDVKITYKYHANPAYATTLTVRYMDDRGNDITSLIVSEYERTNGALPTTAGATNGSTYKEVDNSNGKVKYLKIKAGYNAGDYIIHIPVPKVDNYKYGSDHPKAQLYGGTRTWGSSYQTAIANIDSSWSDANQYFDLTTAATGPIENKEIIVTYAVNPTAIVQLIPINGAGGSIKVANSPTAADYNVNTDAAINLSRITPTGSTTYSVNINPSDMIYYPVPNAGYRFDHWETSAELGSQKVNLNLGTPQTVTGIPNSKNTIILTAKFAKIPSNFNTYHFNIGSHISPLPLGQDAEIANVDASGNPVNLTFGDLSAYTLVTPDSNYTIQWFDGNFNPIDSTTPINSLNGQTFTAFAQPTSPLVANAPTANGQLHPSNGTPSIQIDPTTIDSRLRYVVVDPVSGNVVSVVNGANLVSTGGEIADPALNPGQNYQVYTALPSAVVSVGMPIPRSDVSTPTSATIPTAINPLVEVDANHRGKAKITVSPLSANTDYALIGPGGVVYPFTTPTGSDLVFDNLDPDVNYQIVARPTGSNIDLVTRQTTTVPTDVSTANLSIPNANSDITIIADANPQYSLLRFNGSNATAANPLQGVAAGTNVEIKAAPIDTNSNIFQSWNVISGLRSYNISGDRISFTMPDAPVRLQSVFASPAGNTWAKYYVDSIHSNQDVGVVYPMVNEAGDFRIQIIKSSVPVATRNAIANETDDSFRSVFLLTFNVQKKNPLSGVWEDYTDPSGNNITFDANIVTGALLGNRNYGFYELGGSLASPSNAGSSSISPYTGVDFTSPTYNGEFTLTVSNGSTYALGYTLPDDVRTVLVRDARDNHLVSTLHIAQTRVIEDYANLYTANLTRDYIDNNGITWHYEGVSDDRDSFVPTDTTTRVLADATVYLFFSNDRVDRNQAATDLSNLINQARAALPNVANTGMLQNAIDAAKAVLDKINRKASTGELKAAYDALELALRNAGTRSNGGSSSSSHSHSGGSSGGGGGRGGFGAAGKSKTLGAQTPIAVGISGNWELINPEEAKNNLDNSKWIFKLNSGERVTGWQKLSYTYEGRTKEEWYHFEEDGIMDSGWFLDRATNKWYYLSMNHDGFFGEMIKGWHHDPDDGRWYFLDRADGHMHISWDKIDGDWYYFNPNPPAQTWFFDNSTGRWNYGDNKDIRPLGSMFINEDTPDGFHVNDTGAWK